MQHREDIKDVQEQGLREREELAGTVRQLMLEMKLKSFIVSSFIPQHHLAWIEKNAEWDKDTDRWHIPYAHLTTLKYASHRVESPDPMSISYENDEGYWNLRDPQILLPDGLLSYKELGPTVLKTKPPSRNGKRLGMKRSMLASTDSALQPQAKEHDRIPEMRGLVGSVKHYA
jgi:hypothetical protein